MVCLNRPVSQAMLRLFRVVGIAAWFVFAATTACPKIALAQGLSRIGKLRIVAVDSALPGAEMRLLISQHADEPSVLLASAAKMDQHLLAAALRALRRESADSLRARGVQRIDIVSYRFRRSGTDAFYDRARDLLTRLRAQPPGRVVGFGTGRWLTVDLRRPVP